jgi:hypothetical protein
VGDVEDEGVEGVAGKRVVGEDVGVGGMGEDEETRARASASRDVVES